MRKENEMRWDEIRRRKRRDREGREEKSSEGCLKDGIARLGK